MLLNVDLVVEGGRELLERMDSHLDFGLRQREAATKGCGFGIKRLDRGTRDVLLDLIRKD